MYVYCKVIFELFDLITESVQFEGKRNLAYMEALQQLRLDNVNILAFCVNVFQGEWYPPVSVIYTDELQ